MREEIKDRRGFSCRVVFQENVKKSAQELGLNWAETKTLSSQAPDSRR
jgi:hypothetical protein